MDRRIAQRRAEVRRARRMSRRRRTLAMLALAAFAGGGVALERSPLLAVSTVEVQGVVRLDEADVIAAARVPVGTSTLRLRLGEVESRVESLPLVAAADARRLDALSVVIVVRERLPVLTVTTAAGAVVVDGDGVIIARGRERGLPVIRTTAAHAPTPGRRLSVLPAAANAAQMHARLPGPLRAEVRVYDAHGADDVDLILASGLRVRMGRAEHVDEKARALAAVLAAYVGTPGIVDVRAPSNPVVVPAG